MQISTLQRPGGRLGPAPTAAMPGTPMSFTSSIGKPVMSDDDMSLNDYSSMNPGKFTEDGSFIGQYNPSMKRTRPVVSPTSMPYGYNNDSMA